MNDKKRKLLRLLLLKRLVDSKSPKRRKYWVHPLWKNRDIDGEHLKLDQMFKKYGYKFKDYTRMSPATFQLLLSIVGSTLRKQDTNFRKSIPPHVRLYIVLR